jgi:hypothetical protein
MQTNRIRLAQNGIFRIGSTAVLMDSPDDRPVELHPISGLPELFLVET